MNNDQEKMAKLQMLEQSIQTYSNQKRQFQAQKMETESALEELKKTDKAYKIVGNIMVASDIESLTKELSEKLDMLNIRINKSEKEENKASEEYKELQKEIVGNIKKNN